MTKYSERHKEFDIQTDCHCEPFTFCHSERSEESRFFAQGKLREPISRDCHACVPKRTSACRHVVPQGGTPRNDNFLLAFTIEKPFSVMNLGLTKVRLLSASIHDDISLIQFVIPGLTKLAPHSIRGNPVFFWIPAGVYPVLDTGQEWHPLLRSMSPCIIKFPSAFGRHTFHPRLPPNGGTGFSCAILIKKNCFIELNGGTPLL